VHGRKIAYAIIVHNIVPVHHTPASLEKKNQSTP